MKGRMSVSRCCCPNPFPYCNTSNETSFEDDFSSTDPGWTISQMVVSGGKLSQDRAAGTGNAYRVGKFDYLNHLVIEQEATFEFQQTSGFWGIILEMGLGYPNNFSLSRIYANVRPAVVDRSYFYSVDGVAFTDTGQVCSDGDVVKLRHEWDFTNGNFDILFFVNGSLLVQNTTNRSYSPFYNNFCSMRQTLKTSITQNSPAGDYAQFDDYSFEVLS